MPRRTTRTRKPRQQHRQIDSDPEEDAIDLEEESEGYDEDEDEEEDEIEYEEGTKPKKSKKTQQSQTKKRRINAEENEDYEDVSEKKTALDDLDVHEKENMINDFIRFALFTDAKKLPIKREDVNKNVIPEVHRKKKGLLQTIIIPEAKKRLETIFGFELVEIERKEKEDTATHVEDNPIIALSKKKKSQREAKPPAASMWILRLVQTDDVEQRAQELRNESDGPQMALLVVILSLIFAKTGVLPEEELWSHLQMLGIRRGQAHPIFGNVEKVIDQFIKQLYLEKHKDESATSQHRNNAFEDPNAKKSLFAYRRGTRVTKEMEASTIQNYVHSIMGGASRTTSAPTQTTNNDDIYDEEDE